MNELFTVTVKEASARTGIGQKALIELIRSRKVVAHKPARAWLIDWQSLVDYITEK